MVPIFVATDKYFPLGLYTTEVGISPGPKDLRTLIDFGFYMKFHSYKVPFSQEITNVFEYGRTAEHTIGATIDYISTRPFFSSLSIFWKRFDFNMVILALSSTTIKSLHINSVYSLFLSSTWPSEASFSLSSAMLEKDMV